MFTKTPQNSKLDALIEDALTACSPHDEDYDQQVANIEKLYKIKHSAQETRRVSPDTMAIVAGNLVGIALIVGHERAHVVTTKALSFLMKLK